MLWQHLIVILFCWVFFGLLAFVSLWNSCKILKDGLFPAGKLQAIAVCTAIWSCLKLSRFFRTHVLLCLTFRCCWKPHGMVKLRNIYTSTIMIFGIK